MQSDVADFDKMFAVDNLAHQIAAKQREWYAARQPWNAEKIELVKFVFATDTRKTSVGALPWKNSTTRPKICQIYDNLLANYQGAIFPNSEWLQWSANTREMATKDKKDNITSYMYAKINHPYSNFNNTIISLLQDYILYGNCFATTGYENNIYGSGVQYLGPMLYRISPHDMVMDPKASKSQSAVKIRRILTTMGQLKKDMKNKPDLGYKESVLKDIMKNRSTMNRMSEGDMAKNAQYAMDGFGTFSSYWCTDTVELLEFHGDYFDSEKGELYENQIITVIDRMRILGQRDNPSWNGQHVIKHVCWRGRPDNLWGMGPLDNLVGLQYRLDHLENLKADCFDQIAHPVWKIKGALERFEAYPGNQVNMDVDEDIEALRPDTTALNADLQIQELMQTMEEMAGAPRQAMGIRTPGEKTKFEVQVLENNASRVFQNKAALFEKEFLEPLLNDMLEQARRNLDNVGDTIKVVDNTSGIELFRTITADDIKGDGFIVPMGARHFAEKANTLQNINTLLVSGVLQDPAISLHWSGLQTALALEDLLDISKFNIVSPYIRLSEQAETQKQTQALQEELQQVGSSPDPSQIDTGRPEGASGAAPTITPSA